jgi:hypothetical protein
MFYATTLPVDQAAKSIILKTVLINVKAAFSTVKLALALEKMSAWLA